GLLLLGKTWWLLSLAPGAALAMAGQAAPAAREESAVGANWSACTDPAGVRALDRLPPGVVLSHSDLGATLLLHTRHAIDAAPYHRNVAGLLAEIEAFGGPEAEARRQAELHGADYIVICPRWLDDSPKGRAAFLSRLFAGDVQASWLEPVAMPDGGALKAWRVLRP